MAVLEYRTLAGASEGQYKDRGSRFLAYAIPVRSLEEAQEEVSRLRAMHHAARHCCYAYILGAEGSESRANDDGEPSGSAGRPILGVLLSQELRDVIIVVIRYFGGIKLGVPGLIAAYRGAAEEAIEQAEVVVRIVERRYTLRFAYAIQHEVMDILKRVDARMENQVYGEECQVQVAWSLAVDQEAHQRLEKICDIEAVE